MQLSVNFVNTYIYAQVQLLYLAAFPLKV